MTSPHSSPVSLLESLEQRLAPAGLVSLHLSSGGELTISGDEAANDLQITQTGGTWNISAQAGGDTLFSLNGGAAQSAVALAAPTSVQARLGDGHDDLLLDGVSLSGKLRIDGGDGNDTVDFTGTSLSGSVEVRLGDGADYFTAGGALFFGRSLKVDLGAGANTFEINASSLDVLGSLSATARGSELEAQEFILAAGDGRVEGDVTLRSSAAGSPTTFEIGDLADDVLEVGGFLKLQSGGGQDEVFLAGDLEVGERLWFKLGNGLNTVDSEDLGRLEAGRLSYSGGRDADDVILAGTDLFVEGDLSFSGGAGSNRLDLLPTDTLTINGELRYSGAAGDDVLIVDSADAYVFGSIRMSAASGNNAFGLNAVLADVGGVRYTGGSGSDVVDVGQFEGASSLVNVFGSVKVNTGSGAADVLIRDADIRGSLQVTTQAAFGLTDTVRILDSDVRGTATLNLNGSADSDVVVRDGIFDRAVFINTGAGDDYVALDTDTEVSSIYSFFDGYVRIRLGSGNDILAAGNSAQVETVGNDFNSYVDVIGGSGYDKAYFIDPVYYNGFNGPAPWTYGVEEVY